MTKLEWFLTPKQNELFDKVRDMYSGKCILRKGAYIMVKGEAPVMLVAHMDTVHKYPVRDICASADGDILMSPQGIGGDDRCGVYALASCYEKSKVKPWLLFTCDEEIGGKGARAFAADYKRLPKALKDIKFLIEIDRRGSNDAVYYDCDNPDLEKYITSKGFETEWGSYSDICDIAPAMGVAAVNLSSGYYNAHTEHEYIVRSDLMNTINRVCSIIHDACKPDFPKYEFIEAVYQPTVWNKWGSYDYHYYEDDYDDTIPDSVPENIRFYYGMLLDWYTVKELEEYRRDFGDKAIIELYKQDCDTMFSNEKEMYK